MRSEHLARLGRVEVALGRSEISDAELLEALANHDVKPAHLHALYDRIEAPFYVSMLLAALRFRVQREQGDEVDSGRGGPLTKVTAILSYDNDEQMPSDLKEPGWLTGSQVVPDARYHVALWIYDMHAWLIAHLVRSRGGKDVLREEIAQYAREDPPLVDAPVYPSEDAQRLVQFVDELESEYFPWDPVPLLAWLDPEHFLCVSRKPPPDGSPRRRDVDTDGQNWTRLGQLSKPE